MRINRREFIQISGAAAAGLALSSCAGKGGMFAPARDQAKALQIHAKESHFAEQIQDPEFVVEFNAVDNLNPVFVVARDRIVADDDVEHRTGIVVETDLEAGVAIVTHDIVFDGCLCCLVQVDRVIGQFDAETLHRRGELFVEGLRLLEDVLDLTEFAEFDAGPTLELHAPN